MSIKKINFSEHKVIAIDCDDVLANTISTFLDYYNIDIPLTEFKEYRLTKHPEFPLSWKDMINHFTDFYNSDQKKLNLPPKDWAYNFLKKLKESWVLIYVITARPLENQEYTQAWIEKHFPDIFTDIHFCSHWTDEEEKKVDVCKRLGVTLLIDDCADNLYECQDIDDPYYHITTVLYEKPWNKKYKKFFDYSMKKWK